jgi:integrase
VPKRRYQEGTLRKENAHYFSFFYRDREMENGSIKSVFTRFDLGRVEDISELSARREHDRLRNQINRERGSVPQAPRGEKFKDVAFAYMKNIAPHLSPSTTRQRKSHLRAHLLPRFGDSSLVGIDSITLQCFSTELLIRLSRKSILNVLGTLFAVLGYAKQCGIRVSDASFSSIKLGGERQGKEAGYFKPNDANRIIQEAREPYRTIFALAWATGLRAGELLGLRVADLDFDRKLVQPRSQADDRTRELRSLKTKESSSAIPMTDETVGMLRDYLKNHWKDNPRLLLFPNRRGRPCKRANVVKFGLWPIILKRLELPTHKVGLHAFRHGLGTALADARVSPKVVQSILRHTDIKTTLRFYVHVDEDVQRDALKQVQSLQKL